MLVKKQSQIVRANSEAGGRVGREQGQGQGRGRGRGGGAGCGVRGEGGRGGRQKRLC